MENEEKKDYTAFSPRELADKAVEVLHAKGGFDLRLFYVEKTSSITDYYVVATGRSTTHIKSLAGDLEYELGLGGVSAAHVEGRETASWILLDYSTVIVHIFSRDQRDFYKVERLQAEGSEVDVADFLKELDEKAKA